MLNGIALGAKIIGGGGKVKSPISQEVAKWAVPYACRNVDAIELFQIGNIKGALAIFLELPQVALVQMNIGVCYAELGRIEEAENW